MGRLNATTVSGAGFVVLWSVLWIYSALSPLAGRGGDLSYDPLFYPQLLIYAGLALALCVLVAGVVKASPVQEAKGHHHGRLAIAVALIALYLVLLVPLGFVLDTVAFILILGAQLGYRRYATLAATAVLGTASVWLVFTQVLQAPLPAWPSVL